MKTPLNRINIGLCALLLTGCGNTLTAKKVAESAVQNLGCKVSQSEMWNSLHNIVEQHDSFPSPKQLREALLKEGTLKGFNNKAYENFTDAFVANYSLTIDGIQSSFAPHDSGEWKKYLAEMEVGIRVTSVHADLQSKISDSLDKLASAEKDLATNCAGDAGRNPAGELDPVVSSPPAPSPQPSMGTTFDTVWQQLAATQNPEVVGLTKTLATAYQSCDVLDLAPMTSATPNVVGIKDLGDGTRPGGGHIRKIDNLANVVATDYYLKGQRLAGPNCFDVHKDPPIYNFGAKPYTTSSKPMLLDLFTHVSTGGPTLGIDCSGYVFTALAVMGLKMDPSTTKPLKANLVGGIPSGAFKEPQSNGLRCLDKIVVSKSQSLLPGDIVAINGHVFLIESTGKDPFGLANANSVTDCTASKLKPQNFDFVIAQSSPVKNGIGIDLIQASDYVGSSGTIRDGLVAYAAAACRAKFGSSPNLNSPALSIVRHKRTPECKATPVELARSECVKSCRPL